MKFKTILWGYLKEYVINEAFFDFPHKMHNMKNQRLKKVMIDLNNCNINFDNKSFIRIFSCFSMNARIVIFDLIKSFFFQFARVSFFEQLRILNINSIFDSILF